MADETPESQTDTPTQTEPTTQAPAQPEYVSKAEFARLENALTAVARHLAQAMPVQQTPAPQTPDDLKDEELWGLAQQGNRQAFEMYQGRIAQRETAKMLGQQRQDQTVMSQLVALYQKYPELGDPQHPLTQRAVAFKTALVQMGGAPNARQTDLDAILRAVADSRDIIAPRTAAPIRQATPAGQMGAMHRQPDSQGKDEKISLPTMKLAKQMGVKDPGKAVKKFWERNENGTSRVSPNIAAAIDRQG